MSLMYLTMTAMYNYDNTLFDNLNVPPEIDKNLLVNEILMQCGEFEVTYPDFDFMKMQIGMWGKKHYFTFSKWVEALAAEFNPIHNYDRYEEFEDDKKTKDTTKSNSKTDSKADNTSTDKTSAYDSSAFVNKDQNVLDSHIVDETGGSAETDGSENIKHKAHLYGNIGVTTSVAMLKEFTGFYKDFNIYEQIAKLFVDDFCIKIY